MAAALGSVGLLVAPAVRADGPERLHLVYEATADCPDEAAFLTAVALDGGEVIAADPQEPARSFLVTLSTGDRANQTAGRLTVRTVDGDKSVRDIAGARCDDIARSLAVLVALSLGPTEPGAASATSVDAPAPPLPAPPVDAGPPPAESAPVAPEAPRLEPEGWIPMAPRERAPLEPGEQRAVPPTPRRWRIAFSTEADLSGGISAGVAPGYAFYAEVFHETPEAFAPAIRLGFEEDGPASSQKPSSTAFTENLSFREGTSSDRALLRLDACPVRWLASQPWSRDAFSLQLCARGDVGQLHVVASPADFRGRWIDVGAVARVRWGLPWFFVELDGNLVVQRHRRGRAPGRPGHRPAARVHPRDRLRRDHRLVRRRHLLRRPGHAHPPGRHPPALRSPERPGSVDGPRAVDRSGHCAGSGLVVRVLRRRAVGDAEDGPALSWSPRPGLVSPPPQSWWPVPSAFPRNDR
jgi:hypothetical protein